MYIIPIKTPILKSGDDLAMLMMKNGEIQPGDMIVVSSKAVATTEGSEIDLSKLDVTDEARMFAKSCGQTPEFRQAVINETKRMHGRVLPGCSLAMLTELKPDGLTQGTILAINAGLDMSNTGDGYAIGWPTDPVRSCKTLRRSLDCPVIISDSCCRPRRLGVTAMAITVCGIDPFTSQIGKKDLFGHSLTMTVEALADQLATAANMIMGNASQRTPAAIIRNHDVPLSDFAGFVPGIDHERDLFLQVS